MRPTLPYVFASFADGTSFVHKIFRIGYCIRGNKYFLYKWSTVCKACIIIWQGGSRQLYHLLFHTPWWLLVLFYCIQVVYRVYHRLSVKRLVFKRLRELNNSKMVFNNPKLSINILCLSVCLSVCLLVSNKRQNC